jgi:hypothetical protein
LLPSFGPALIIVVTGTAILIVAIPCVQVPSVHILGTLVWQQALEGVSCIGFSIVLLCLLAILLFPFIVVD